jgi:hypothetical protein
MFERREKPVDVYDHTNAMGSGFLCLFSTPFVIAICVFLAEAIFSSYWVALPLIIIGVPAFWIMIFYYGSTWTRKEAEARGRDWD